LFLKKKLFIGFGFCFLLLMDPVFVVFI
jgi:hypothetical protein